MAIGLVLSGTHLEGYKKQMATLPAELATLSCPEIIERIRKIPLGPTDDTDDLKDCEIKGTPQDIQLASHTDRKPLSNSFFTIQKILASPEIRTHPDFEEIERQCTAISVPLMLLAIAHTQGSDKEDLFTMFKKWYQGKSKAFLEEALIDPKALKNTLRTALEEKPPAGFEAIYLEASLSLQIEAMQTLLGNVDIDSCTELRNAIESEEAFYQRLSEQQKEKTENLTKERDRISEAREKTTQAFTETQDKIHNAGRFLFHALKEGMSDKIAEKLTSAKDKLNEKSEKIKEKHTSEEERLEEEIAASLKQEAAILHLRIKQNPNKVKGLLSRTTDVRVLNELVRLEKADRKELAKKLSPKQAAELPQPVAERLSEFHAKAISSLVRATPEADATTLEADASTLEGEGLFGELLEDLGSDTNTPSTGDEMRAFILNKLGKLKTEVEEDIISESDIGGLKFNSGEEIAESLVKAAKEKAESLVETAEEKSTATPVEKYLDAKNLTLPDYVRIYNAMSAGDSKDQLKILINSKLQKYINKLTPFQFLEHFAGDDQNQMVHNVFKARHGQDVELDDDLIVPSYATIMPKQQRVISAIQRKIASDKKKDPDLSTDKIRAKWAKRQGINIDSQGININKLNKLLGPVQDDPTVAADDDAGPTPGGSSPGLGTAAETAEDPRNGQESEAINALQFLTKQLKDKENTIKKLEFLESPNGIASLPTDISADFDPDIKNFNDALLELLDTDTTDRVGWLALQLYNKTTVKTTVSARFLKQIALLSGSKHIDKTYEVEHLESELLQMLPVPTNRTSNIELVTILKDTLKREPENAERIGNLALKHYDLKNPNPDLTQIAIQASPENIQDFEQGYRKLYVENPTDPSLQGMYDILLTAIQASPAKIQEFEKRYRELYVENPEDPGLQGMYDILLAAKQTEKRAVLVSTLESELLQMLLPAPTNRTSNIELVKILNDTLVSNPENAERIGNLALKHYDLKNPNPDLTQIAIQASPENIQDFEQGYRKLYVENPTDPSLQGMYDILTEVRQKHLDETVEKVEGRLYNNMFDLQERAKQTKLDFLEFLSTSDGITFLEKVRRDEPENFNSFISEVRGKVRDLLLSNLPDHEKRLSKLAKNKRLCDILLDSPLDLSNPDPLGNSTPRENPFSEASSSVAEESPQPKFSKASLKDFEKSAAQLSDQIWFCLDNPKFFKRHSSNNSIKTQYLTDNVKIFELLKFRPGVLIEWIKDPRTTRSEADEVLQSIENNRNILSSPISLYEAYMERFWSKSSVLPAFMQQSGNDVPILPTKIGDGESLARFMDLYLTQHPKRPVDKTELSRRARNILTQVNRLGFTRDLVSIKVDKFAEHLLQLNGGNYLSAIETFKSSATPEIYALGLEILIQKAQAKNIDITFNADVYAIFADAEFNPEVLYRLMALRKKDAAQEPDEANDTTLPLASKYKAYTKALTDDMSNLDTSTLPPAIGAKKANNQDFTLEKHDVMPVECAFAYVNAAETITESDWGIIKDILKHAASAGEKMSRGFEGTPFYESLRSLALEALKKSDTDAHHRYNDVPCTIQIAEKMVNKKVSHDLLSSLVSEATPGTSAAEVLSKISQDQGALLDMLRSGAKLDKLIENSESSKTIDAIVKSLEELFDSLPKTSAADAANIAIVAKAMLQVAECKKVSGIKRYRLAVKGYGFTNHVPITLFRRMKDAELKTTKTEIATLMSELDGPNQPPSTLLEDIKRFEKKQIRSINANRSIPTNVFFPDLATSGFKLEDLTRLTESSVEDQFEKYKDNDTVLSMLFMQLASFMTKRNGLSDAKRLKLILKHYQDIPDPNKTVIFVGIRNLATAIRDSTDKDLMTQLRADLDKEAQDIMDFFIAPDNTYKPKDRPKCKIEREEQKREMLNSQIKQAVDAAKTYGIIQNTGNTQELAKALLEAATELQDSSSIEDQISRHRIQNSLTELVITNITGTTKDASEEARKKALMFYKQIIDCHLACPGKKLNLPTPQDPSILFESIQYLADKLNEPKSSKTPHEPLLHQLCRAVIKKAKEKGSTYEDKETLAEQARSKLMKTLTEDQRSEAGTNMFIYLWHNKMQEILGDKVRLVSPDYGSSVLKRLKTQLAILYQGPLLLYTKAIKDFKGNKIACSLNMLFGVVLILANVARAVNASIASIFLDIPYIRRVASLFSKGVNAFIGIAITVPYVLPRLLITSFKPDNYQAEDLKDYKELEFLAIAGGGVTNTQLFELGGVGAKPTEVFKGVINAENVINKLTPSKEDLANLTKKPEEVMGANGANSVTGATDGAEVTHALKEPPAGAPTLVSSSDLGAANVVKGPAPDKKVEPNKAAGLDAGPNARPP